MEYVLNEEELLFKKEKKERRNSMIFRIPNGLDSIYPLEARPK